MTIDKVKWGFIGCGEVTEKKSGPAFSMIRNSEVVAVMSRDLEKAASYARRHNIPRWYNDAQLLIGDEDVNAIYIATPPSSHATFAIMAMKAGKTLQSKLTSIRKASLIHRGIHQMKIISWLKIAEMVFRLICFRAVACTA